MGNETQTVTVPHLGSSTIGYKFGRPSNPDLPTLVMANSFSTLRGPHHECVRDVEVCTVGSTRWNGQHRLSATDPEVVNTAIVELINRWK